MSVYKHAKSPFYQYDFQINGRRFLGSTKARNKQKAQEIERQLKAQAKKDLADEARTGNVPLTIDLAAGRYYTEVGQYHACSADTYRALERLVSFFGKDKRLSDITDGNVTALTTWRRQQQRWGKKEYKDKREMPTVSPATVNRDTTAVLKKLFTRAKLTWKYHFPSEPNWKTHWLKEADERVRELHLEEGHKLDEAIRADYEPWLEFARITGLRRRETLIRWPEVNWFAKRITKMGKGSRKVTTPITPEVWAILEPLKGHHDEWVFTYVAKRNSKGKTKGQRYPITYSGSKSEWQRTRKRSGIEDFRFHDIRHDVATKVLRATGNLKLTQKVLNHASMKTTARYAHVLDEEVADALEKVAKSRKKSRTSGTDVA
ncbi:integrase [Ensifer sp. NM-2]|uniref:tyrosine-type recombinase/integrase n=1 Tax=Ensifer sp. NM-2 TaxID=2109730 RepID=UPI000D132977|nr:site-specific integrase [Ensifer sp. NM-2]PSS62497.1 integrase [Ensifer sp. NM-2]